jgi:hypothetical protein
MIRTAKGDNELNIFYLDNDPEQAAYAHCDKHVVKMILETAQLLSTAHHVLSPSNVSPMLYKKTHQNHPSAVWCRSSADAYLWTLHLGVELLLEYRYRYGKRHASTDIICGPLQKLPRGISLDEWVDPPYCGPAQYASPDPVTAYRRYYMGDKARFAKWTRRPAPVWWSPGAVQAHADLRDSPPF